MKTEIKKGELMEEKLKNYFLEQGYFVTRGIKFKFDGFDITDVDLLLYNKTPSGIRDKIIVDIKNKKTPQAIERIFWTKGLAAALRTQCIVATTERRESVKNFGRLNSVIVLDGNFIGNLLPLPENKLSEDEFISKLRAGIKEPQIKDEWFHRYEAIKQILLLGMDFSGLNWLFLQVKFYADQCITNPIRRETACRLLYISISHSLILLDYLLRDFTYASTEERAIRITEGLKFGNLGKQGLEKTIELLTRISPYNANIVRKELHAAYDNIPIDILKDYFSKNENVARCFDIARIFSALAFEKDLILPSGLPSDAKGILLLFMDYSRIERNKITKLT